MQTEEIQSAVKAAIPGAEVEVTIDGSHAHLIVTSSAFTGLTSVKKQQMVYGALQEAIASGAIHAVHIKTLTP